MYYICVCRTHILLFSFHPNISMQCILRISLFPITKHQTYHKHDLLLAHKLLCCLPHSLSIYIIYMHIYLYIYMYLCFLK